MTSAAQAQSAPQAPSDALAGGDGRFAQAGLADAQGHRRADDQVAPGSGRVHGRSRSTCPASWPLRDQNKGEYQAQEGISLTFDAFVAKATVDALSATPTSTPTTRTTATGCASAINLGVAVAVDDGLVVPVIKDADRLSIHGLNRADPRPRRSSARQQLTLDDIQGGTFTLDNTGWTGSIITQPIINAPQVGILTMESIVKRPVVVETGSGDLIGIRPMMYMTLGFDHRATDGAQAGRFVADVKRWLEAVDSTTAIW